MRYRTEYNLIIHIEFRSFRKSSKKELKEMKLKNMFLRGLKNIIIVYLNILPEFNYL